MGMIEWQMGQKSKPKQNPSGFQQIQEIPGAEINPLKNPMPKFEALKISRKH